MDAIFTLTPSRQILYSHPYNFLECSSHCTMISRQIYQIFQTTLFRIIKGKYLKMTIVNLQVMMIIYIFFFRKKIVKLIKMDK